MLFAPTPPTCADLPQHVAVIMDGNGRWAKQRHRPRAFGHRAGVRSARNIVKACHRKGIAHLTLFAFSQENWQRPPAEVGLLMQLFANTLAREIRMLHDNTVRVRFIGDLEGFSAALRKQLDDAERLTAANTGLNLNIAAGYGGRWDIAQAAAAVAADGEDISAEALQARLCMAPRPDPDLLIRTGGEHRLSNFMLWQLSYTELYFIDTLWPDFDAAAFDAALDWYRGRERRFGRVAETA